MPSRTRRTAFALVLLGAFLPEPSLAAGEAVRYEVAAPVVGERGPSILHVTMGLPADAALGRLTLIMPRAIPMGYGFQPYDEFVSGVAARSKGGLPAAVKREDGPRWRITSARDGDPVQTIEYDVDLTAMESTVLAGGDSSRTRPDFIGLLGYSVFAFVEGLEDRPVEARFSPPANRPDWPVFSTLAPSSPVAPGPLAATAADFYDLADSQILMGRGFKVMKLKGWPDLYLAAHAEGPIDLETMAPLAEQAYDAVIHYFGEAPFPHYSLVFDYLRPLSARHTYGFSMEHMQSATFGAVSSSALTATATDRERASFRYNLAHHISHAWIPKRCAGEGYFPFRWELAPLIDTIWLSEGFSQYAAADALSDVLPKSADGRSYRDALVEARFLNALGEMPEFLKQMPLVELSRVASTVYSEDFRTGRTVFSRGGLMARDMDERIRSRSGGAKRLRDALRGLIAWSARERRPFRIDELPGIFKDATGVETADILRDWLGGMK